MNSTEIFTALKEILYPYSAELDCNVDRCDEYYLNTKHIMKNKKPLFFAATKINKNYVSFHLMPVYVKPELLKSISPALKKHMQGKSCFNFKKIDDILFVELKQLTNTAYRSYVDEGYI